LSGQDLRRIYRKAVDEVFPEHITLTIGSRNHQYDKVQWTVKDGKRGLRYGTNPHQRAALYKPQGSKAGIGDVEWIKWGKDGPSATNIEDGSHGNRIVSYFDKPAVSVMKHLNPSGVAVRHSNEGNSEVYRRAREADPRAAFGSVVVLNFPVDIETAKEVMSTYVEVVYAPDFQQDALPIFEAKKDIRIGKIRKTLDDRNLPPDIVVLDDGSVILEDPYKTRIRSIDSLNQLPVPTKRKPSESEYRDLLHAWWVACEVRSNAIVLWKHGASLAIGTGQQDRVGALENCVEKAHRFGHDLRGSSLASDGFFPKTDNIDTAAAEGISAIVQPGGSVEDNLVIEACDKNDIAMVLTGERSFRHF
jgi:phosphoribosylaminoimidazolecarboxamide formyltransferase/IMP cyclohydrolase